MSFTLCVFCCILLKDEMKQSLSEPYSTQPFMTGSGNSEGNWLIGQPCGSGDRADSAAQGDGCGSGKVRLKLSLSPCGLHRYCCLLGSDALRLAS